MDDARVISRKRGVISRKLEPRHARVQEKHIARRADKHQDNRLYGQGGNQIARPRQAAPQSNRR
jgi:hypothetical protein